MFMLANLLTLRVMIPFLIGFLSLLATGTSWFISQSIAKSDAEKTAIQNLRNNLTSMQGTLEVLLSNGQPRAAEKVVASFSAHADTVYTFFANKDGRIVASTSHMDFGTPWLESHPDLPETTIQNSTQNHNINISINRDKDYLDGYIGICPKSNLFLRSTRCGFLTQRINLHYYYQQASTGLRRQALYNALSVIMISTIIATIFHFMFASRAYTLAETLKRFKPGNRKIKLDTAGQDELSVIAQNIERMLDKIEEDQEIITEEKNRLSSLFETAMDPIFTIDENGKITSFNSAACVAFDYSPEQLKKQNMFNLMPDMFIADEKGQQEIFKGVMDQRNIELAAIRSNQTHFPAEFAITTIDKDGMKEHMVIVRDVTIRKNVEEELRKHRDNLKELVDQATSEINAIVDTAVDAIITINHYGTIQLFNPAAEKLFGWKASEVIGKNVAILTPDITPTTHDQFIGNYLKSGKAKIIGVGRELEAKRKDNTLFPALLSVGHTEVSPGNHMFVAFISDITRQITARRELLSAKNRAEEAAQAKANFLANMSHEIRTPMNAVIGFSEVVLQDTNLSDSSRQHVSTILNAGQNLLNIINDILDFSKIEAGKVTLEHVTFHLPNAITDTLRTLEFKAAEKDLILKVSISPNLPNRVVGDPVRLRQVLLNLVGNAIKFTQAGSVTVVVEPDTDVTMTHFKVIDTGIGMNDDQLKGVFEAFTQADASTNRRFGGTGLGTTISKQIVELMHGKIWAESEVNKGSTFHFTAALPAGVETDDCLFEDGSFIQTDYRSPRAFNILLAEDLEANASLATLRLKQQGHDVHWVINGAEAVNDIKNADYDIILMDIQMPEMDGLAATKAIRQWETQTGVKEPITIVALTASVMKEDKQDCYDVGMNAVASKPINFPELMALMEQQVPQNLGTRATAHEANLSAEVTSTDLSPLEPLVDYVTGIKTWLDADIYLDGLINFARDRQNDALKITDVLKQSSDNHLEARKITHALKGLAGNLSITEVAQLADDIDLALKSPATPQLFDTIQTLHQAIQDVVSRINSIKQEDSTQSALLQTLDTETGKALFNNMISALDDLNPDSIAPLLDELASFIEAEKLAVIQQNINDFEFDDAKTAVIALATELSISLENPS